MIPNLGRQPKSLQKGGPHVMRSSHKACVRWGRSQFTLVVLALDVPLVPEALSFLCPRKKSLKPPSRWPLLLCGALPPEMISGDCMPSGFAGGDH